MPKRSLTADRRRRRSDGDQMRRTNHRVPSPRFLKLRNHSSPPQLFKQKNNSLFKTTYLRENIHAQEHGVSQRSLALHSAWSTVYPRLVAGGNAIIFDFFAFGLFHGIMKHFCLRSWSSEIVLRRSLVNSIPKESIYLVYRKLFLENRRRCRRRRCQAALDNLFVAQR